MYIPKPVDTNGVNLSPEMLSLTEILAENAHDTWAKGRMDEGWVYGKNRDDKAKTHPCLIPYEQLPESEKDYDREAALQTIKLIMKMGYKIVK